MPKAYTLSFDVAQKMIPQYRVTIGIVFATFDSGNISSTYRSYTRTSYSSWQKQIRNAKLELQICSLVQLEVPRIALPTYIGGLLFMSCSDEFSPASKLLLLLAVSMQQPYHPACISFVTEYSLTKAKHFLSYTFF